MVGWQRHLQCALRRIRRRLEHSYSQSSNYSSTSTSRLSSSLLPIFPAIGNANLFFALGYDFGKFDVFGCFLVSLGNDHYFYFQENRELCVLQVIKTRHVISTSRKLLAGSSEETPISSPLTPVLAIDSGKTEEKKVVANRTKVQVALKKIKQSHLKVRKESPKKVNLVAALIRVLAHVIHSARANATHNHGLDPNRLLVGNVSESVSFHGKGLCGIKERSECRLTVVVREMTAEEEAETARLRVSKFRKLTKLERRLVPHKLIETTPLWNRKGKASSQPALNQLA
ncbi:50S ribosomal protein L22, chloroplastic-like [Gossypium australe]|uniref:50S ribosomal protein L22, chloroplastic-like n=1 Tax=Gossypium australe TaxID=47621 RepID=A0A5B6UD81_9ROSI|nr:50S ribosomal protein L22, chloroplastic-like [Gossypium australe]